jgi:DNA-binding CsgD family transcriptional regulator
LTIASLYSGLKTRRDGFGAGSVPPADDDGCLPDEVDTYTKISDPRLQVSTPLTPGVSHHPDQEGHALGERGFETTFRRGMELNLEEATAYALNERSQPSATRPASDADILTPRERQVADLIAQGLTNKGIAAKLMISQRTAESHVEHILGKLGFTSRHRSPPP